MPVPTSNSELMQELEKVLDRNEEYIGQTVWNELDNVYTTIDARTSDLEDELEELKERVKELEQENEELEKKLAL